MFLKSLTLKGFKSFADTTSLDFEPGVTVVVGPNGSGKSNIVDAVAWVLGAQGPRALRSTKMEDVIFAGTPKRPALGRAEVSLTIDNQSGLLPIGFSEVTVTRTLFRSGDSEYAINGAPCRLLDVQELLSDTGVGRQQHVIVSQGQLDAVLNARPEDRRLIIEEAAGILKFRKRKERAERRLEATEGSLLRLQDLLREVRRQLRPLERQAEAARRHDGLQSELRLVKAHLAGRELAAVEGRLAAAAHARVELSRVEEGCQAGLRIMDEQVASAESELDRHRQRSDGIDLAEALSSAERLGATARGLAALIAERRRAIERDRQAALDGDVVASLEAEAAQVAAELAATAGEAAELAPRVDQLVEAEAAVEAQRQALGAAAGTGVAGGTGGAAGGGVQVGAAEVRAELAAHRRLLQSTEGELRRLDSRLSDLQERDRRLAAELARLAEEDAADGAEAELLRSQVAAADAARHQATEAAEQAATARHDAEREQHRWAARAEALASGLAEARARAGFERLADIAGVVGTLVELVEIDPGWESAFEAAVGEAVAAVIVDGVDSARRSLEHLRELRAGGAVLPLEGIGNPGDGPATATAAGSVDQVAGQTLPSQIRGTAVAAVRDHVRSAVPGVASLLDGLLSRSVAVEAADGWPEALDAALDAALGAPGLVVVTKAGDRFTGSAWTTGAGGSGATAAALEDAARRRAGAEAAVAQATGRLDATRSALDEAGRRSTDLQRRLDAITARAAGRVKLRGRAEAERRDVTREQAAQEGQRVELAARRQREAQRVAELEDLLPQREQVEAAQEAQRQEERAQRARLGERSAALSALRRDIEVQAAALEQRRTLLVRRYEEIERRLREDAEQRQRVAVRREEHQRVAQVVDRLEILVAGRAQQLDAMAAGLRAARAAEAQELQHMTGTLDGLRRERAALERQLAEQRERLSRVQLEETEATLRREALDESVRRDLECEVESVRDAPCPDLPPGTSAASRSRELERDIRLLGPINPLAMEEFQALQERQEFLDGQLDDVRSARRELGKVIRAVDAEIVDVFRAAYADVSDNFEKLFSTLFPGGQGRLRLTDPDHLLETGVEVEARPSGKNVRRLSLLSGGERSLTALALLFAVFRSRPSPFYLMDEVEAALDDVNLMRFLDLLREFRQEAQLLVVSHQKRTMEAADWLYGVTMQPGGSSRVVSERVAV